MPDLAIQHMRNGNGRSFTCTVYCAYILVVVAGSQGGDEAAKSLVDLPSLL